MKKIILLLIFTSFVFIGFSQKTKTIDTSELCIPYGVAQKMLLDLNEYDKLKELSKLDKEEIKQLNNKIYFLDNTINTCKEKDSLSTQIVSKTEEKFKIISDQNDDLRKEIKKLKVKNTMTQIISGVLLTTLTIFSITK
jgi:peptidoglycan hydrolase CwlO-like protein